MRYFEDIELNQLRESREITLEKDQIINFAKEWDPQPFHIDEVIASQWPLGLTASGVHTIALSVKLSNELKTQELAVVAGLGWDEVRLPAPVRPGDRLRVKNYTIEKRESKSKPDRGIMRTKIEVWNQNNEIVLSYILSSLIMKRPL